MPIIELDTLADPRLEAYRSVADPAALRRRGWFVAEGRLIVERLLALSSYQIESLLITPSALRALAPVLSAHEARLPIYVCPAPLFEPLTGHDFHRGCLGLARRPKPCDARSLIAGARRLVVLEGVANVDNLGGVFRNAAAFGADGVLLDPTCADPLYRKAIRTSMGATLSVPFARLDAAEASAGLPAWPEALSALVARGFDVLALTPQSDAEDLDRWAARATPPERLALLLGAEGPGLSAAALARATLRLRIAMQPGFDSLNLAVACGIALHRLDGLGSTAPAT